VFTIPDELWGTRGLWGNGPLEWLVIRTDAGGEFLIKDLPKDAHAFFDMTGSGRARVRVDGPHNKGYAAGNTDVRIELKPEAVIEGTVIDKTTRKPVKGVVFFIESGPMIHRFVSGGNGHLKAEGLSAGTCYIRGYRFDPAEEEGTAEWVFEPFTATCQAGRTTGVMIEVGKGGILEVLVTDAETGDPIPDAEVTIVRRGNPRLKLGGRCDQQGLARIRVHSGERISAGAKAPGYSEDAYFFGSREVA
ncbi:unnamed protein product, partial [marine sediment metagenome]